MKEVSFFVKEIEGRMPGFTFNSDWRRNKFQVNWLF